MHIILSPAKTMAGTSKIKAPAGTTPRFNQEAIEIALHMAQYPAEELGRMLKLSPKLMLESYHRFQNFHSAEEEPLQQIPRFSCGKQPALASDTRLYRCRIQEYQSQRFYRGGLPLCPGSFAAHFHLLWSPSPAGPDQTLPDGI